MKNRGDIVAHLFRTEYGKLVAGLTRFLGSQNLELAEDMVQETLIAALHTWAVEDIPDNPAAWLMQVAKRKALNQIKRDQAARRFTTVEPPGDRETNLFLPQEIQDDQLRMIFTCCHPDLSTQDQVALTLKALCGFGIKQLANAFLTTESVINKRLFRARKTIRIQNLAFSIPSGPALEKRLASVELAMYLLFSEGYDSSKLNEPIHRDFCLEAIRLTQLLSERFEQRPGLKALLALMCLHTARFDARIDQQGAIVILEDQDRKLWNQELISIGIQHLQRSQQSNVLTAYHLEAAISAEHCLAPSFELTNWRSVKRWTDLLFQLKPNPIIKLNLAIIHSQIDEPETALSILNKLGKESSLKHYYLLPATRGTLHMKWAQYGEAIQYFNDALALAPPVRQQKLIEGRIGNCLKRTNDEIDR